MMFGLRAITDMDSGLSVDPIVANSAEVAATSPAPVAPVTPAPATTSATPLLLLAVAGVVAYWWYSKKHKGGVKLPTFDLMGVQL